MIKAIFIIGPTASGKTSVSIELAKRFNGEIISADSMQIYKGIHIASAAPNDSEKEGIPHHLIEFLNLDDEFSVADYVKMARSSIRNIHSRGKLPIIVGGTGLYISSLLENIEYTDQKTDYKLRQKLESEFDLIGGEKMLEKLREFDSDSALRLHPNNRRRIIRAFEVFYLTGKTITEQNLLSKQNKSEIEPLVIGLNFANREVLYKRINDRVDKMLESGLLEEARQSFNNNLKSGAFQAIGHKELYPHIIGEIPLEDAVESLKMSTRRYAKRQITWFKNVENVNWFYLDKGDTLDDMVLLSEKFLKEK
ncbi:MAG: tRNA (adenosine(37)-N6)-dimethylallyltransferase MiaA [Clostridia bacterium]|nr:tRNA (adenosine(37)-N6)-dimethylallyltransferase MiaA [Clostridia bacterium]